MMRIFCVQDRLVCLRSVMIAVSFSFMMSWSNQSCAGDIAVMVSEPEGLPVVSIGGGSAMTSHFAFWADQWKWVSVSSEFKRLEPFQYLANAQVAALGLGIQQRISKVGEKELRWSIDVGTKNSYSNVIGGGMVFNFDLNTYRAVLGEPVLLPNNTGWTWGKRGTNNFIEMRFEPALPSVYFERNQPNEIRAFFLSKTITPGSQHYSAVLSVAAGVAITPTVSERYGAGDVTAWFKQEVDWKNSPVDLSFLNRTEMPAGKHGFLKAVGEKLIFNDGVPARFWGTNLTAYALFGTPKEQVKEQARRLSQLGFNLVRLHHHDSPWVAPNVFGNQTEQTTVLDAAMLDKLDWWIKCLKDEGIYVWLDMHAQRFLSKNDSITAFEEISRGKPTADLKGYSYVNPSIQTAMKDFSSAYLQHINSYTGKAYKDEPAIAAILITNENDITYHFGNALLPDKNVPWHDEQYMRAAKDFAAKSGLNPDLVWRSWEPGQAKYFLNDLEYRFNVDMIAHLRGLGVKVPIVTTNTWGANPLSSLPALTAGDMIDVHSYGGAGELEVNPAYSANIIDWIAAAQVVGKPVTVSEWNVSPYPVADRHNMPMYIAAVASHQGWDAIMQYAYSQEPLIGAGSPTNWHAYNDPALLATLPAAALMYRQGHVSEASINYVFTPKKETLFNQLIFPTNAVALRTAVELGKLTIAMPPINELPWLKPSQLAAGCKVITDPGQSLLTQGATGASSDTGQLKRDWAQGTYTIDTPYTQAAMGWIGGKKIVLSDVGIAVKNNNATVSVQTLDGSPIKTSKQIYITAVARTQIDQHDPRYFFAEPMLAVVRIAAPKGLKLFVPRTSEQLPVSYSEGYYQMNINGAATAYLLTNVIPTVVPKVPKPTIVEKPQPAPVPAPDSINPYKLNLRGTDSNYRLNNGYKNKTGSQ